MHLKPAKNIQPHRPSWVFCSTILEKLTRHSFFRKIRRSDSGMMIRVVALAIVVFALRSFIFSRAAKAPDSFQDENFRSSEELAKFWAVVLGVGRNASHLEIQIAFQRFFFQYPPDKNKNEGAQVKLSEINNAYDFSDIWSNYFGGDTSGAGHFGGFSGSSSSNQPGGLGGSSGGQSSGFNGTYSARSASRNYPKSTQDINFQVFEKEIVDQGITWLLLSYSPSLNDIQDYESVIENVATSLQGALKAGRINCEAQRSFCWHLGIYPRTAPRVFVYSQKGIISGSFVEYKDDWAVKNLKIFCQEHLPRFSRRVKLDTFRLSSSTVGRVPSVMLLSTKKDTPVIWRVLSGLYRKRFIFYNVVVQNASDKAVKKLGVDALPAIVGWMSNGEKHVLETGISVKDLNSAIQELSTLLNGFERKNKKAGSSQAKKVETESVDKQIH